MEGLSNGQLMYNMFMLIAYTFDGDDLLLLINVCKIPTSQEKDYSYSGILHDIVYVHAGYIFTFDYISLKFCADSLA